MAVNPFCPILIILHESLLGKTMITMIVGFTVQYLFENDKLKKRKRHSQFFLKSYDFCAFNRVFFEVNHRKKRFNLKNSIYHFLLFFNHFLFYIK